MKAGKHCATEVPAALTMDECWELVEVSEKTGRNCMMLEQVNYIEQMLRLLHMCQTGVFGEIVHAAGGYVHDLRLVKCDPSREPWRMGFEFGHNGNLYPTHPIGPISWWLNVNRGDRYETIVSMSTKAVCNNEYMALYYGERHPYATAKMSQGDSNTSLLSTVNGKTVTLHYDTNTPHPHTGEWEPRASSSAICAACTSRDALPRDSGNRSTTPSRSSTIPSAAPSTRKSTRPPAATAAALTRL
jgi:predicted dehydrogenase